MQTPSFDMPRPIYGGVSPVVPTVSDEEEHRPIYGGANPLENTQSVPIVPPRPVATKEVKVDIPTVEIPARTSTIIASVTQQVSNDIFASSSVPTSHVSANPVSRTKSKRFNVPQAYSISQKSTSRNGKTMVKALLI